MEIDHVTAQVLKFQLGSTVTVAEMQELAAILEEKCSRQQPFGLIMVRDGERQHKCMYCIMKRPALVNLMRQVRKGFFHSDE
ncbi:hypothetical protein ABTW76_07440 [Paenibacillus dendritiformis]